MSSTSIHALDLLLGEPWAIRAAALEQILSIAARTNDSPEAVAARLGRPLQHTRTVTERDGTAIIPVTGPIFRRANLFTEISGATSVEVLATDIQTAIDDPAITRLLLEFDSPGGQATGISELATMIHASPKPVVAYVDGQAASAAYWLAAAADQIVLSSTALVGSIGVVLSYRSEKDAPLRIVSSQSPLKQATPDTDHGRAEYQRLVDQLAAVFVADVAAYRQTTPETVMRDFGQGGVLVGQHAVAAHMADTVGTLESTLNSRALENKRTMSQPPTLTTEKPMHPTSAPHLAIGRGQGPNPITAPTDAHTIWANSPALQAEFGDFDRWQAYQRAVQAGRARTSTPVVQRGLAA